jgi:serine/threonine-protein kinase RsbW
MAAIFELRLPREGESVRRARRFVESVVSTARPDGPIDDLLVAVSELCTNVVQHSDVGDFGMRLEINDEQVELEVFDRGGPIGAPYEEPTLPPPTSMRGRGLAIVDTLVDHLRIHLAPDGGWRVTIRKALRMSALRELVPSPTS